MRRKDFVITYLTEKGYTVNADAFDIIKQCDDWYSNRIIDDFHMRKNLNNVNYELNRMNFAKRCCADDANLCEVISVAPEKKGESQQFINELLSKNRFNVQYRKQLEKTSATGTVGAYIYLKNANYLENADGTVIAKGGNIRINYCDTDCIVPLTIENDLVTECAFSTTNRIKGKEKTTLVIFELKNERYKADTIIFDEKGKKIDAESSSIQLGEVKPFSIMVNAEVNNLDNMQGYGLPKIYNAIPMLKAVDLCYSVLFSDLSKADKIILINELLCEIRDKDGKPTLTPKQKEIFVMLGDKLPDEKSLVQEYNPQIRIEQITKVFELVLSLLSMLFGYGTKKYTFENGQIKTATEYIGTRQDAMQELNKQRNAAKDYIEDIIHAAMWFSNQFRDTNYNIEEALNIEFDDSYIEDKQTKLETMRADALSFMDIPWLTFMYIKTKYNLSDEEAERYIKEGKINEEDAEELED